MVTFLLLFLPLPTNPQHYVLLLLNLHLLLLKPSISKHSISINNHHLSIYMQLNMYSDPIDIPTMPSMMTWEPGVSFQSTLAGVNTKLSLSNPKGICSSTRNGSENLYGHNSESRVLPGRGSSRGSRKPSAGWPEVERSRAASIKVGMMIFMILY